MTWYWPFPRTVDRLVYGVLILRPHGVLAVDLEAKTGVPLHRVMRSLRRLQKRHQAMPLELEPGVRVWMAILPEDGDR